MATTTPKRLYGPAQPTSSAATLYTVPGSTVAIIRHIRCTNKDVSTAYDLELWIGGSTDALSIIAKKTIPAGGEWEDDCYIPMAAAEILQGKSSTSAKLTLTVGGAEIA